VDRGDQRADQRGGIIFDSSMNGCSRWIGGAPILAALEHLLRDRIEARQLQRPLHADPDERAAERGAAGQDRSLRHGHAARRAASTDS
jgi:hypothetical protein